MYVSITDYFPVVGLTQLTEVQAGGLVTAFLINGKTGDFTEFDGYVHPLTLFSCAWVIKRKPVSDHAKAVQIQGD